MQRYILMFLGILGVPLQVIGSVAIGHRAPEIALSALLPDGQPAAATLSALRGKAVVLEFWATWCGPCHFAIPHMNDLVTRFENRPIQFISISDEDRQVVEAFLNKRPIKGWVGLETGALRKAYGITGIPVAVLIDANGIVAAVAHPSAIQAQHLEELIAGKHVTLPPFDAGADSADKTVAAPDMPAIIDVQLRVSTASEMSMSNKGGRQQIKGVTPRWLLSWSYKLPVEQIICAIKDDVRYDLALTMPQRATDRAQIGEFLQAMVRSAFGLTVKREVRETQVLVLTSLTGEAPGLQPTATPGNSAWMSQNGEIHIVDHPVSVLADVVRGQLKRIVVDETSIAGRYDFDLRIDPKNPDSLLDSVRKYGLAVQTANRPVEFLVVSKTE